MKAIIFNKYFEPPDELKNFCESIGYKDSDYSTNYDLMFDERVVEFCEKRLSNLWNEKVYKDNKSKIGFIGAGYVRDIDITKKWRIKYNNVNAPIIDYVNIGVDRYGHVTVKSK